MGRLRTSSGQMQLQRNRQLKEYFMHGLNDEELLAEIIRELIKCEENITIHSENVLTWAKRVEVQRAQAVVISSLHEKTFAQSYKKMLSTQTKDPQQIHSALE